MAITGYDAVSVQPNAGSQGELAGLLAIRAYHRSRGDDQRTVLPHPLQRARHQRRQRGDGGDGRGRRGLRRRRATSTSPTSAGQGRGRRLAPRRRHGHLPLHPRRVRGGHHASCAPSSTTIGGQVYVDGANLNALVGIAQPGRFGADVSHLNLHKTFCIPHGGGGPGVGPIGVRAHLAPFLPGHPLAPPGADAVGPVSAAPFGSAGILAHLVGVHRADGRATGSAMRREVAVANANYVAARLRPHFPVLLHRSRGLRRPRVHPRPAPAHEGHRRHRRRRRQAADGLRLPRAHDELPGGGDADGRADGERGPARARPLLRRHDRHPG